MLPRNLLALWLVMAMGFCPIIKADPADDLAAARTRIAQLELEAAKLRDRIQSLEAQLLNGPTTAPANAVPMQPTTMPAATQPSKAPAKKTYLTVLAMFEDLPGDARPDPKTGWDTFRKDHAQLWFDNNIAGAKFDGQMKVSMSVFGRREITVEGQRQYEYTIMVSLEPTSGEFAGITLNPNHFNLVWKGDEHLAQTAKEFAKPVLLRVTGTIKGIGMGPIAYARCNVNVVLENIKVYSPLLPP